MPHDTQKIALITGAARRIGAEIAETLHAAGMTVVVHYHASTAEATALCEKLNQRRANSALAIHADLSEITQIEYMLQQVIQTYQRLDVLVNNASNFYKTIVGDVTEYAWNDLLNINARAPFFLSQAAAPYLKTHKGSIVNIIDIHAERPMRDYAVYCIAKAALLMMTKVFAKELAPDVRVNGIAPGTVLWPEGENTLTANAKEKIMNRVLLENPGTPAEIAKTVLFFVEQAHYVTGQVLAVDGGRTLTI